MSTVESAAGRFVWHDHMSGDPDAARRFEQEPFEVPTVGRMAILTDPQGAVVGLFQPETQ